MGPKASFVSVKFVKGLPCEVNRRNGKVANLDIRTMWKTGHTKKGYIDLYMNNRRKPSVQLTRMTTTFVGGKV